MAVCGTGVAYWTQYDVWDGKDRGIFYLDKLYLRILQNKIGSVKPSDNQISYALSKNKTAATAAISTKCGFTNITG